MRSVALPITMGFRIFLTNLSMLKLWLDLSSRPQLVISTKEAMLSQYLVCTLKVVSFLILLKALNRADPRPPVQGHGDASMDIATRKGWARDSGWT